MNKEKLNKELDNYNKLLEINPYDATLYRNRGNVLDDLIRWEEALDSYDKALEINPNDAASYIYRGNILENLGRRKEALDSYDKALEINSNDDTAYFCKGSLLAILGRLEEALDNYDKSLKINPNNDVAYRLKGGILEDLGRQEEALANYDKALHVYPNESTTYFCKGNLLAEQGRLEEALDNYDKALEINPNDEFIYQLKGNVLGDMGRLEEALTSYDKALEINPKNDKILNNKGYVLSNLGKKEEALACYIHAIQINPDNEIAKRNRRTLIGSLDFWDSLSKNSQVDLWNVDEDFNTLVNRENLKGCSGKDLQYIRRLWVEQYRLLYLLSADLDQVGHYTSSTVFETLLQEQKLTKGKATPLLLCSLAAANDPTEGIVFQTLLGEDCMPFQRIHSNLAVLQTSFSSTIDSLNQFRLYGKNNGEEGTGLCLVFNRSFFASPGETSMIAVRRAEKEATCRKLPLYWVLYYDRDSGRVYYTPACTEHSLNKNFEMEKTSLEKADLKKVEDIGKSLKRIQDTFKAISEECQQTALEMLIYLRHLVKDAAFKDEKELRILSLHPYNDHDPSLKVLPGKNCLSVDYLSVIDGEEEYLEKVIAGPKLRDFANLVDVARFRLHHLGGKKEVEFCQSQAPLN
ncbi:hypothetical protein CXU22_00860 [Akkermansia muciniphila]|uniref:Uncharacterized protein n=1 Tax=Akkermansia muciniphila TaxID=239935 RepID=A0A2N8HH50_9BACT|nr:tetratricopeptide repeat protein [Akkermansia muciniphila]PNC20363.1 hypothetical protein CXU22_00860 [Akkermansia muciniphila]